MDNANLPNIIEQFPELEMNEEHPLNDRYYRDQDQVKRLITAEQRQMTPRNVQIVKAHFKGIKNVNIAEEYALTPTTISKIIHTDNAQRLLQLLHYFQASIDGPSVALRKNMLHRIAKANETENPKVAISAVAELNKMGMNEHVIEAGGTSGNVVQIQINNNHFPKTNLDG